MTSFWIIAIIGVLVYVGGIYVLKRVWKRLIKQHEHRELATFLSALLLIPVVLYLGFNIWLFSISYYPQKKFEPTSWEKNIENRFEMSDSIITDSLLVGKTKEDVKAILGNNGLRIDGDKWTYDVGFLPGFHIDPSVLCIEFENNRVVRVYQYET